MVLGIFSDTHAREDLFFPDDVEVFIHCGDILDRGDMKEVIRVANYFKSHLNGQTLHFTPGNHDKIFESSQAEDAIKVFRDAGIIVHIDERVQLQTSMGLVSFYFFPWVPEITPSHSFNLDDDTRKLYIDRIPNDVEVLVTHGPAKGCLDGIEGKTSFGDELLRAKLAVSERLLIHCFGHVHEARGVVRIRTDRLPYLSVNASSGYNGPEDPIILNISKQVIDLENPH